MLGVVELQAWREVINKNAKVKHNLIGEGRDMKYSQLIKAWDELHVKDTGDIGFCDLDNALSNVGVKFEMDIPGCQPTYDELSK